MIRSILRNFENGRPLDLLRLSKISDEQTLLDLLDRAIHTGRIRFNMADRSLLIGRGPVDSPEVVLRIDDPTFFTRVLAEGNLGLAESYMSGGWHVEQGSLEQFLIILVQSRVEEHVRLDPVVMARMAALRVEQLIAGAHSNIKAHYDVGDELYGVFLDETRGYTCGYQKTPEDTLKQLQENKYDRICQKLRLEEGESLFDIGCGYGGLIIHAAKHYGVQARGITNSQAHGDYVQHRIKELGLEGRVHVEIGDFRTARGQYDKVCSVGLFEHLYPHEHGAFFKVVTNLLRKNGFALLHTLGCVSASNEHDPFIQKYIFPGSTQNPISVIAAGVERQGFAILDVENIAKHYHPTTRAWLDNFRNGRHTLDPAKYDATFLRMWEYYLALCVAASGYSEGAVWQVLFTPEYRRLLPLHRV